jgi:hypothetical protein
MRTHECSALRMDTKAGDLIGDKITSPFAELSAIAVPILHTLWTC